MGKSRVVKASVTLDSVAIDACVKDTIEGLEKEVASLKRKLQRRDQTIASLRNGMDLTKERRERIRDLAGQLHDVLEEAEWVDVVGWT